MVVVKSAVYLQEMGGAGGGRLGLKVGFLAHNLDYRCDNLLNLCLLLCMVDYWKDNLDYYDYYEVFGHSLRLSQIISSGRSQAGP